ncbi:hypothetical protein FRAHR75_890024 [Frankia sp. Hr75.2]|nr:hypothetical protein FRAHR75_890024 [Frankia sp. Hr75.2]
MPLLKLTPTKSASSLTATDAMRWDVLCSPTYTTSSPWSRKIRAISRIPLLCLSEPTMPRTQRIGALLTTLLRDRVGQRRPRSGRALPMPASTSMAEPATAASSWHQIEADGGLPRQVFTLDTLHITVRICMHSGMRLLLPARAALTGRRSGRSGPAQGDVLVRVLLMRNSAGLPRCYTHVRRRRRMSRRPEPEEWWPP